MGTCTLPTESKREYDFMLALMPVRIHGKGKSITAYAFPDSGSKASFVDEKLAQYLELDGEIKTHSIKTINGSQRKKLKKMSSSKFPTSTVATKPL